MGTRVRPFEMCDFQNTVNDFTQRIYKKQIGEKSRIPVNEKCSNQTGMSGIVTICSQSLILDASRTNAAYSRVWHNSLSEIMAANREK